MRTVLALLLLTIVFGVPAAGAEEAKKVTMYKDPQCGCCGDYAEYLERRGFKVTVKETTDLAFVKRAVGVPPELQSCHTMLVDGYTVEGHVPAEVLDRLLAERPAIRGISLPGMPAGSPGMSGVKEEPFTIYEIADPPKVYAVE